MKTTISRLAYRVFMSHVENDLISQKNSPALHDFFEESVTFFQAIQSLYSSNIDQNIDYDILWSNIGILIQKNIQSAVEFNDFAAENLHRNYLSLYFSIENDFILRDSLLDDTVIANIQ